VSLFLHTIYYTEIRLTVSYMKNNHIMAGDKILVFGATGPAGLCLLRELRHRRYPAIAYCRNPSKIPNELTSDALLEVSRSAKMWTSSTITDRR
jgi:hypothetical protein